MAELTSKPTPKSLDQKSIVGHGDQIQVLERGVGERTSGVFLLNGPQGIGKRKTAKFIAQKFLCTTGEACGVCPPCQQIRTGQSPSVHEIAPEDEMIRVDVVQKLLHSVQLRSLTQKRFVIIDGTEKMNQQAANTLLKTLEEPPEGLYFFLITSQISRVLKTIRSRSQVILFSPLSNEEMHQLFPQMSLQLLHAARGGVNKALELVDTEHQGRVAVCQQYFAEFKQKDFLVADTGWREFMKNKDQFLFLLSAWENLIAEEWKATIAKNTSSEWLEQVFTGLSQIRKGLRYRADDVLQIESLWTKTFRPTTANPSQSAN